MQERIDATNRGLDQLPQYDGTTYRATNLPDSVVDNINNGGQLLRPRLHQQLDQPQRRRGVHEPRQDNPTADHHRRPLGQQRAAPSPRRRSEAEILFSGGTEFEVLEQHRGPRRRPPARGEGDPVSGRDDLDRHDAGGDRRLGGPSTGPAAKEAHADDPLPEFNRVKHDDYPHWKLVAYMFHTRAGERVLVDRGDGAQVEGTLGGVRAARSQDELLVDLDGATGPAPGPTAEQWAPEDNGRVRVETLTVPVLARHGDGRAPAPAVDPADQHGGSAVTQTPDLEALLATLEQLPPHVGSSSAAARRAATSGGPGGPTSPSAAVDLPRPARRDRELHHRRRLRHPEPHGPGDRAVLRSPSRARGRLPARHRLHPRHPGAGQGPRRHDRRGVRSPSRGEPEPVDFAAVQEEIGRALAEAELREPVPPPIAGKFAGDIA